MIFLKRTELVEDLLLLLLSLQISVRNLETIPSWIMVLLDGLLEVVAEKELNKLHMTLASLDALAIFEQFEFDHETSQKISKAIADANEAYINSGHESIHLLILGSLRHLICHFEKEDVEQLMLKKGGAASELALPILGTMNKCTKDTLNILSEKVS